MFYNILCDICFFSPYVVKNTMLITGDEKGTVSTWSIEENTINVWIPIPNMISCLEMSPNLVNVAAIGYKKNVIFFVIFCCML